MVKKKKSIAKEVNRFKSVEELIKSFEESFGLNIDPEEIDTREKLLDKISEMQNFLVFEVLESCNQYFREADDLTINDDL